MEVRLSTDEQVLADAVDSTGFLAGLAAGVAGLHRFGDMLLTVLGALLPFAVAGMLVTAPVVLWLRRARTRRRPRSAAATPRPLASFPLPPRCRRFGRSHSGPDPATRRELNGAPHGQPSRRPRARHLRHV